LLALLAPFLLLCSVNKDIGNTNMALVDPNRIKASIAEDKVVNRPGGIMQPKFSLGKVVEKPSVFNFDYWREEKAPLLAAWMKMDPNEQDRPDPSLTFGNLAPFKPMEDLFPRTSVGFPKDEPKAITTFALEDDNLVGRFDGQRGYVGTDTSSAVADALIGNSVAALPKADEIPALKIDNSNARTSGTGLMASTKGFETKEGAVSFIRDFVDLMGDLESTEDHVDSAGTTTLAYGILPTTAAGLGIDPTDYPDRKSFARAVYSKMYDEAKVKQAATFNAIPKDKHGSVMALYANVGEAGYNKLETVKGHLENNNLPSAGTALTQIVLYSQRDDDGKKVLDANGQPIMFASKGLSARRAKEYNILMSKEPGFKKVRTVTVSIKNNKPTFKWLDVDRNVVKSYTAPAPLSADNDTTDQPI
jgi:hypothetical protein